MCHVLGIFTGDILSCGGGLGWVVYEEVSDVGRFCMNNEI